jgi:hypothetical protein
MRPRTASAASSSQPGDERLRALFQRLDLDGDGCLTVKELCSALQQNPTFAQIMGLGDGGDKPLSPLAAGLIANNLRHTFDEFGDADGTVSPEEFVKLCRSLVPPERVNELPLPAAEQKASAAEGSSKPCTASASARRTKMGSFFSSSAPSKSASKAAEARLQAVQRLITEDIVSGLETLLERASSMDDVAARASTYHQGICDVLSTCRRLADTTSDDGRGAHAPEAGAAADAFELLSLRGELASTKVALAEAVSERQAVEHTLRTHMQSTKRNARRNILG